MLNKVQDLTTPGVLKGLNTQYNILALQKDQSPNMMDVKVNFDGSIEKRPGTNKQNALAISNSATAGFSPNISNLTNGLVSYWNLNEASGTRGDSIGVSPLLDIGGTLNAAGIKGQAASFVNVGSNVTASKSLYQPNASTLSGNRNFSFATWFYMASTMQGVQRTILSKRDSPASLSPVLLLHMDGAQGSTSFTDSELTPKTVTPFGNAIISTSQSQFGGASAYFDGTNSYLAVNNSPDFNFGTGDYTVDAWVNWKALQDCSIVGLNSLAFEMYYSAASNILYIYQNGNNRVSYHFIPTIGTFYHIAAVRASGVTTLYVNGISVGTPYSGSDNISGGASVLYIGKQSNSNNYFSGYIDEVRILKGTAAWTSNFSVPISAYSNPVVPSAFEYQLYVDTDNLLTFEASSSGLAKNGMVKAASFGAIGTANWYNAVAWVDSTNNLIGISVNLAFNTSAYTSGMYVGTAPFSLASVNGGATYFFDGKIDETGYWNLVLNSGNRIDLYNSTSANSYQPAFSTYPWASFDFGASALRWLTVGAGTGVYASSDLGVHWVTIATDRSATYQYYDRSKNVEVLTSDAYDTPLAWSGSAGTFATVLNSAAPLCKYNINFSGFLILLNSNTRKRSFNYIDENLQLTGTGWLNFDIPSSADDEITAVFVLRRYLYVSTRYKIFRVTYVGGNPDWQFVEIKNWGFIPRTAKKLIITNNQPGVGFYYSIGEVVVGLTYDRKIRIFDGSGDQIISNNIEKDNRECDFAIEKIPYIGSGPVITFAEVDPNQNVYKLVCAIGGNSSQTTHMMNYDGRSMSLYTYANQQYNCMCMAESANQRFLMAFDRSGFCHMMDSGNLDGNVTPINDYFVSPLLFEKTPSQVSKGHKVDFFFSNTTAGNVYFLERVDYENIYHPKATFNINGSDQRIMRYESVDTPTSFNVYQFMLTSSSGTAQPWRLQRYDDFCKGMGIGRNYWNDGN